MILVVDTNIFFSALIKRGFMFDLLFSILKRGIQLYSPQYLIEEIERNNEKLLKYSKLSQNELNFVIEFLLSNLKIIAESEYVSFLLDAKNLAPHIKDVPYFALALQLNCPIWSNEMSFKEQPKVKVYSTSELLKELKLEK